MARFVLSVTLAWAGAAKIRRTDAFARSSRNLLPRAFAAVIPIGARLLPVLELAAAGALLTGRWAVSGLLVASALFTGFLAILVRARLLGLDSSCSCFGAGRDEPVDALTIARTAGLWAVSLAATAAALADSHPQLPLLVRGDGALTTLIAGTAALMATVVAGTALRLLTSVETEIRARGGLDHAAHGEHR